MANLNVALRDYQQNLVEGVYKALRRGKKRIMCSAPTGAGKTIIFTYIAKELEKQNKRVLIITHRVELLYQTTGAFNKFGIEPLVLNADTKIVPIHGCIVVAMVETLHRRLSSNSDYENFLEGFDTIIIDEAHIGQFDKLFEKFNKEQIVLGFSATPYRRNPQTPLSTFYDALVEGPSVKELIKKGFLSQSIVFGQKVDLSRVGIRAGDYKAEDQEEAFEAQLMYDSVVENYIKHAPKMKALLFAPTVASSMIVTDKFRKAGIKAAHVDADTPKEIRKQIFSDFNKGEVRILCNQGITNLGFDEPSIELLIIFRATRSLTLYLQMIGRGSRIFEDMKHFFVFDFGNNTSRFGFYEDDREWSLHNDTKEFKRETTMTKICPACDRIVSIGARTCPGCGHVWFKPRVEELREAIKIDLIPLSGLGVLEYALGKSFEELTMIQELKGYKKGWIQHQITSLKDLEDYGKYMNYKRGWFEYAKKSFRPKSLDERKSEYKEFIHGIKSNPTQNR